MQSSRLPNWIVCALVLFSMPQFRPPNPSGISAANLTLHYADANAHDMFWNALGGRFGDVGRLPTNRLGIHVRKIMNFPGLALWGLHRGAGTGVTVAMAPPPSEARSVPGPPAVISPAALSFKPTNPNIDAIGFKVRSLAWVTANLQRIGVMPLEGSTSLVAYFKSPNGIRVRIAEDASLSVPIKSDEVSLKVSNVVQAATWYQKTLGARITMQSGDMLAEIPGMNIRFIESKEVSPRVVDHIKEERLSFEVSDLERYMKRLASEGVTIVTPYYLVDDEFRPFKAFGRLQDPFGNIIELTEGFQDAVYEQ